MYIMKYLYDFNMETCCLFLAAHILEEEDGKILRVGGIKGTTSTKLEFSGRLTLHLPYTCI